MHDGDNMAAKRLPGFIHILTRSTAQYHPNHLTLTMTPIPLIIEVPQKMMVAWWGFVFIDIWLGLVEARSSVHWKIFPNPTHIPLDFRRCLRREVASRNLRMSYLVCRRDQPIAAPTSFTSLTILQLSSVNLQLILANPKP